MPRLINRKYFDVVTVIPPIEVDIYLDQMPILQYADFMGEIDITLEVADTDLIVGDTFVVIDTGIVELEISEEIVSAGAEIGLDTISYIDLDMREGIYYNWPDEVWPDVSWNDFSYSVGDFMHELLP